jgi:NADH:ubiquinone oxidoreductase subunit C
MFKEADKNDEVLIPQQQTPVHIIEIEDETNETSSKRKDEINIVDVNDKLQLNNIEKEKVILISDNDRDIYKEKYNIDYNEDNNFKVMYNLYKHFTKQLSVLKITILFNDENIRTFANIYTNFR